jgi:hypothetical protein
MQPACGRGLLTSDPEEAGMRTTRDYFIYGLTVYGGSRLPRF